MERDLSLTALVVGTNKISFTSLRTSDTNSFRVVAFNDEIIFIASFIPTCFLSTIFLKVFISVGNLNLSRSSLKSKDVAKVQDQNLLHATLLKAVLPLSEEFQSNTSAEKFFGGNTPQLLIQILLELLLPHNDLKFFFLKVVLGHQFLVFVLIL